MGRFCPEGFMRFRQAMPGRLELTFGGAEANVAASLSMLGAQARFVTALPDNEITAACLAELHGLGVDTSRILVRDEGRFGLYFVETGANQRPSNVIYDRAHSTISLTPAECYDWPAIFDGAEWFHVSGITPAISQPAADAALAACKAAKTADVTISCDLNFRKKLWRWDSALKPKELAEKTMREILPFVDVIIGNEEDASDVLGIQAGQSNVDAGQLDIERYPQVARSIREQFPRVAKVAITLRESLSASHNNWGAMLYDAATDQAHFAPTADGVYQPYEIKNIVDRVGGGDSFSAGLIYAFNDKVLSDPKDAVAFAVAASCLAHSVIGDVNYSTRGEVLRLMKGNAAGRVVR
ncbi:MAG: sugar kinase [Phycisphaerae bacterium]|nr:sugar kinase [Phycisphaerae bacterium]